MQVEERLRFYEEGVAPRKNLDMMAEALAKVKEQLGGEAKEDGGKKKDKKDKGRGGVCWAGAVCVLRGWADCRSGRRDGVEGGTGFSFVAGHFGRDGDGPRVWPLFGCVLAASDRGIRVTCAANRHVMCSRSSVWCLRRRRSAMPRRLRPWRRHPKRR
jgi:hypothetical protein